MLHSRALRRIRLIWASDEACSRDIRFCSGTNMGLPAPISMRHVRTTTTKQNTPCDRRVWDGMALTNVVEMWQKYGRNSIINDESRER